MKDKNGFTLQKGDLVYVDNLATCRKKCSMDSQGNMDYCCGTIQVIEEESHIDNRVYLKGCVHPGHFPPSYFHWRTSVITFVERPEKKEEVKEITMEQLCKALGYTIKIIKG